MDGLLNEVRSGRHICESQYVDAYLRLNGRRGEGRGFTIPAFLTYQLRGKEKDYARDHARALRQALEARVAAGQAVEGVAMDAGQAAWYPYRGR